MPDLEFVHRYLQATNPNLPVLLLLHGTGGNENDLIPLADRILSGAAVLSVRGKVLENGMSRFFRRFAEGKFDLEDLRTRTQELAQFLDAARQHYGFQKSEYIAVGYSNGANIASSLAFTYPSCLKAAVLLRAMFPFRPEPIPDLSKFSVLLSEGEHDPIVPKSNAAELEEIYKLASADVTLHWHRGGHELGKDDVDAAQAFLSKLILTKA